MRERLRGTIDHSRRRSRQANRPTTQMARASGEANVPVAGPNGVRWRFEWAPPPHASHRRRTIAPSTRDRRRVPGPRGPGPDVRHVAADSAARSPASPAPITTVGSVEPRRRLKESGRCRCDDRQAQERSTTDRQGDSLFVAHSDRNYHCAVTDPGLKSMMVCAGAVGTIGWRYGLPDDLWQE